MECEPSDQQASAQPEHTRLNSNDGKLEHFKSWFGGLQGSQSASTDQNQHCTFSEISPLTNLSKQFSAQSLQNTPRRRLSLGTDTDGSSTVSGGSFIRTPTALTQGETTGRSESSASDSPSGFALTTAHVSRRPTSDRRTVLESCDNKLAIPSAGSATSSPRPGTWIGQDRDYLLDTRMIHDDVAVDDQLNFVFTEIRDNQNRSTAMTTTHRTCDLNNPVIGSNPTSDLKSSLLTPSDLAPWPVGSICGGNGFGESSTSNLSDSLLELEELIAAEDCDKSEDGIELGVEGVGGEVGPYPFCRKSAPVGMTGSRRSRTDSLSSDYLGLPLVSPAPSSVFVDEEASRDSNSRDSGYCGASTFGDSNDGTSSCYRETHSGFSNHSSAKTDLSSSSGASASSFTFMPCTDLAMLEEMDAECPEPTFPPNVPCSSGTNALTCVAKGFQRRPKFCQPRRMTNSSGTSSCQSRCAPYSKTVAALGQGTKRRFKNVDDNSSVSPTSFPEISPPMLNSGGSLSGLNNFGKRIFTDDSDDSFTTSPFSLIKNFSTGHLPSDDANTPERQISDSGIQVEGLVADIPEICCSQAAETNQNSETSTSSSSENSSASFTIGRKENRRGRLLASAHSPDSPPAFLAQIADRRASAFGVKRPKRHQLGLLDVTNQQQSNRFHRCFSEADAKTRLTDRETGDAIGDGTRPHSLPSRNLASINGMKVITGQTLSHLLKGRFDDVAPKYAIVDCRYPYEYLAGHVQGALSIYSQAELTSYFMDQAKLDADQRPIVIFYCEFSSERGPKMLKYLRKCDRGRNDDRFPFLYYPEVYLLEGGYKKFFESGLYSDCCEPNGYKPMADKLHLEDLKRFKAKSKSWSGASSSSSDQRENVRKHSRTVARTKRTIL